MASQAAVWAARSAADMVPNAIAAEEARLKAVAAVLMTEVRLQ